MGRKGKWLVAAEKVFSPKVMKTKSQTSKNKWELCKCMRADSCISEPIEETTTICDVADHQIPPAHSVVLPPAHPPKEETKVVEGEDEQSKHTMSMVLATAVAAEAAAVAAQAAAEVMRLTASARFSATRSREEAAAIKIQTAFRAYRARRALQGLRGLIRLKSHVEGNAVRQQTANTLQCMQTLARVQSQIRSRRIRMAEENQAFERQLQLKHERELEKLKVSDEWDSSSRSKEQADANALNKHAAAMRRERTLAYAFSHQRRSSSKSLKPVFIDHADPNLGWSWLERWMAARPWESRSTASRELNNEQAFMKSANRSAGWEILKAYAHQDTNSTITQKSSRPPSRQSPPTPLSKVPSVTRKTKSASPKGLLPEDDSRSIRSSQSERPRRHSLPGPSFRDDESLSSSTSARSYMAPTQSAKAKSRFQSSVKDNIDTTKRRSASSAQRMLSFAGGEKNGVPSPAQLRRYLGPHKVGISSLKEVSVHLDNRCSSR